MSESEKLEELEAELSDLTQQVTDEFVKGTLVDEFLMKQSREIQIEIRETLRITGISPNDPYFLMLLQARVTEVLYKLTPNKVYETFLKCQDEFIETLNDFKIEFITDFKQELSEKPIKLSSNVNTTKNTRLFSAAWKKKNIYVKSFGFLSLCLIGSCLFGFFLNQTAIAKARKQNLAKEDQATLKWAKSKEGQLAQNIIAWNEDLVNGKCKEKVESLGLSFQLENTKTTSGFCVLYVEPSNQRSTTITD